MRWRRDRSQRSEGGERTGRTARAKPTDRSETRAQTSRADGAGAAKRSRRPRAPLAIPDAGSREALCAELERRGVAPDFAEALALRLEVQLEGRDEEAREAVLDGIATAYAVESRTNEALGRHARELHEIERLMKSFVGELSKLDEALEVLAAYLRRMRSQSGPPGAPPRVLH